MSLWSFVFLWFGQFVIWVFDFSVSLYGLSMMMVSDGGFNLFFLAIWWSRMYCVDFINSKNVCSPFVAAHIVYMPLCSLLFHGSFLCFCSFSHCSSLSPHILENSSSYVKACLPPNCWKALPRSKSTPDFPSPYHLGGSLESVLLTVICIFDLWVWKASCWWMTAMVEFGVLLFSRNVWVLGGWQLPLELISSKFLAIYIVPYSSPGQQIYLFSFWLNYPYKKIVGSGSYFYVILCEFLLFFFVVLIFYLAFHLFRLYFMQKGT